MDNKNIENQQGNHIEQEFISSIDKAAILVLFVNNEKPELAQTLINLIGFDNVKKIQTKL